MKKNLFLYVELGFLVSCHGLFEQHTTAFYQEVPVQTVRIFAQEANLSLPIFSEKEVSLGSAEKLTQDKPRFIIIEVVPDLMKFDTDTFTVTAGEKIILELDNMDGMQHNLLISEPGTLEKIGSAADAMLRDPKAAEMHYIPDVPEVLFATELVDPGEIYPLEFTAPTEPGEYPFVCTFPGHWRMMNGIMKVERKKTEEG
jgi:azurin